MIQPPELKLDLEVSLSNGVLSTTTDLWNILVASRDGDLENFKRLVDSCPELIFGQYNYAAPIHFAVREGHLDLVKFLLANGAHDPSYKIYPFNEPLDMFTEDRGYEEIGHLLRQYSTDTSIHKYKGDNGEIHYNRTPEQKAFQRAVSKDYLKRVKRTLDQHPEFANDQTYFWSEGIMTFAAKNVNREMVELLTSFGARVPPILKWAQFYYFDKLEGAKMMMETGMNPNTMSWHHVTLLHDMAQKGNIPKAELLLKYGASLNEIDEEYLSTPLGMAARWGKTEMVAFLLKKGADPDKAGAEWSSPVSWARKKGHEEIVRILHDAGAQ